MATVMQRMTMIYTKKSSSSGELYCRLPGRNPFWTGYSASYSETTTQIGQGTGTMPVFIEIGDGEYRISVNAPKGKMIGKFETNRAESNCGDKEAAPEYDVKDMPESEFAGTSFEVSGKTTEAKPKSLSGSKSLPDGRTRMSWSLRLVAPKGK
jgi:hypothetical protein